MKFLDLLTPLTNLQQTPVDPSNKRLLEPFFAQYTLEFPGSFDRRFCLKTGACWPKISGNPIILLIKLNPINIVLI